MYRIKKFSFMRKQRKYKNVPHDFKGEQYHSKFEAKVARDLDLRLRAGDLTEIKRQVKIDLYAYDTHICDYWIDFVVIHRNGDVEFIECKGVVTRDWRIKWKMFEAKMKEEQPQAILTVIR